MKRHNFIHNGRKYTIEQGISGDYCRLKQGEEILIDDSACEDFYGEPEELEDIFKAYLETYNA